MNGVFGSRRVRADQNGWEPLEPRCVLSAESLGWDGPGQGTAALTYYLGEVPSDLDRGQVETALETALAAWSEVIDVEFAPTDRPNQLRSIDFSFVRLDGPGGTLAQAYLPADVNPARIAGDVQFDLAETWEVGNRQGAKAFDLVLVAVHELGHALGLDHAHDEDAVMAASVSALASFQSLAADDIDAALALYAPAAPSGDTAPSPANQDTASTLGDGTLRPPSSGGENSTPLGPDTTSTRTPTNGSPTRWTDLPTLWLRWPSSFGTWRFAARFHWSSWHGSSSVTAESGEHDLQMQVGRQRVGYPWFIVR